MQEMRMRAGIAGYDERANVLKLSEILPEMSSPEQDHAITQERAIYDEITAVIDRFALEWDMTTAQVVGILEIIKQELVFRKFQEVENEPDEPNETET